jgi:hypothetical protein
MNYLRDDPDYLMNCWLYGEDYAIRRARCRGSHAKNIMVHEETKQKLINSLNKNRHEQRKNRYRVKEF